VYATKFGAAAAPAIERKLSDREREILTRALRARPPGADPLTIVDYLYLGQLTPLLLANDVWAEAKARLIHADGARQRLDAAISQIAPVRNEIAHVREVDPDRLMRATVACSDVLQLIGANGR
jgi:hypothetical protein